MEIKGYWRKLSKLKSAVAAVFVMIAGGVISSTSENSKLPDWVATTFSWMSSKLESAINIFVAGTIPVWFVLVLSGLVALVVGVYAFPNRKNFKDTRDQLHKLQLNHDEIVQENSALKKSNDALTKRYTDLDHAYAGASDSMAEVKRERDNALREMTRIKNQNTSLPQTFAQKIRYDQSAFSTILGTSFPKTLKVLSTQDISERNCVDVLENVMLCTIKEVNATFDDVQRLTSLPRQQLESCLEMLQYNNYVQVTTIGVRPRYQLTPRARKHFVCKENGVKSELSFIK